MFRRIDNGDQERRWIEEARLARLKNVKTISDAIHYAADFGIRVHDFKKVFALRRELWAEKPGSSGQIQPGIRSADAPGLAKDAAIVTPKASRRDSAAPARPMKGSRNLSSSRTASKRDGRTKSDSSKNTSRIRSGGRNRRVYLLTR